MTPSKGKRATPARILAAAARILIVAASAGVSAQAQTAQKPTRLQMIETTLQSCRTLKGLVLGDISHAPGPDEAVMQCRGLGPYELFVFRSGRRSTLALGADGALTPLGADWGEAAPAGQTPYLAAREALWLVEGGAPRALIAPVGFRAIEAATPAPQRDAIAFYAVYDVRTPPPRPLGRAATRAEAEALALAAQ